MMLQDKVAVVYGAGGGIGGAVARAFASEGAQVFLTGRNRAPVDLVANDIAAAGGSAGSRDVVGDQVDGGPVAPGEKYLGTLRRKSACDRAADPASSSIDHRNLVLQHHRCPPCVPGGSEPSEPSNDVDTASLAKWAPTDLSLIHISEPTRRT